MGAFTELRPPEAFRHSQQVALDAFEADCRNRRTSTHLVAPPGSGKTVVGLEVVRRLDRPALVLAPATTIAEQWERTVSLFTETPSAFVRRKGPLHVLTYQSVCQTTDPAGVGPVDFEVPTPAVVRDGHLAPDQELAWFTAPLQSEHDWLAERHLRFAELLDHLHSSVPREEEHLAFAPWVIGRIRHADDGTGQSRVAFATLAARRPDLARAGLRYLHADDLELPADAPRLPRQPANRLALRELRDDHVPQPER